MRAVAVRVLDAHAPRRVDENRHDGVAGVGIDAASDRPEQEHDEREEGNEAKRHEDAAPPRWDSVRRL